MAEYNEQTNIRLTESERESADQLASENGVSTSEWVRSLVEREIDRKLESESVERVEIAVSARDMEILRVVETLGHESVTEMLESWVTEGFQRHVRGILPKIESFFRQNPDLVDKRGQGTLRSAFYNWTRWRAGG